MQHGEDSGKTEKGRRPHDLCAGGGHRLCAVDFRLGNCGCADRLKGNLHSDGRARCGLAVCTAVCGVFTPPGGKIGEDFKKRGGFRHPPAKAGNFPLLLRADGRESVPCLHHALFPGRVHRLRSLILEEAFPVVVIVVRILRGSGVLSSAAVGKVVGILGEVSVSVVFAIILAVVGNGFIDAVVVRIGV